MDYNKLLRQTVNNLGGGEDVIKDMQTRINKQSYTPIKEDGIWGEETQRAVNMLDDVTLQSINNRMIEDNVLKLNDEGNTDRATYQKYLSTHTTKAPKMDLNDKLNQGVRENRLYNGRNLNDFDKIYYSDKEDNYIGIDIHEGGYSNNPEDKGGRTNFGITQSALDEYNNADANTGWVRLYKDKSPMAKRV